ncbi:MAG: transporter substrate-binding domain-containing protein [Muribaculaceae bacterium]|nr:transporter substrate-binding domain-containing protein [Muribaculaceae bacterium]
MLTQHTKTKNKQLTIYIVLLVAVLAFMLALGRCGKGGNDGSKVNMTDTLRVAIEFSPMYYYTYDDTLGGYNYDLLRLISQNTGKPMKFTPVVTLSKAIDGLDNGTYDLLVAQFPMTAQNSKLYAFTQAVYLDRQVLVQLKNDKGEVAIKSQLDLAGDTVHVVKDSPMEERVESLSREIGDTIHVVVDEHYGPEQLFLKVVSGEVRFAVINETIARQLAKKYKEIDISTAISFSQKQSWVLSKDNTVLRDSLNSWLTAAQSTRQDTRLRQRYDLK